MWHVCLHYFILCELFKTVLEFDDQRRIYVPCAAQPDVDGAVDSMTNPEAPRLGGVIGGHEFEAGKWPWLVSMQVRFMFVIILFIVADS